MGGTVTTTNWVYEGETLLSLTATQGSSSWRIDYLYGEDGVLYGGVYRSPSTSTSPTYFTMVTDDRGDVVELLDAAGNPFAAYHYDCWGWINEGYDNFNGIQTQGTSLINSTLASSIVAQQHLTYAGYVYDSESNLYYCNARYYDPATRQWTTADPAKADGEESAYQYAGGDPVARADPSGDTTAKIHWPTPGTSDAANWQAYGDYVLRIDARYVLDTLLENLGAGSRRGFGDFMAEYWHTFTWWALDMEAPDHPWDLKASAPTAWWGKKYISYHGYKISPRDFGNIHFGFTGSALFIPAPGLDCLSGVASVWKGGWSEVTSFQGIDREWTDEGQINRGVEYFEEIGPWLGYNFHFHFVA